MLDAILWFGFGAILISLMGYGVEQNGQEVTKDECWIF